MSHTVKVLTPDAEWTHSALGNKQTNKKKTVEMALNLSQSTCYCGLSEEWLKISRGDLHGGG